MAGLAWLAPVLLMLFTLQMIQARSDVHFVPSSLSRSYEQHARSLKGLFEPEPLTLSYQGGRIFTGNEIAVYIIWYGSFSALDRSNILDFFASFQSTDPQVGPSVRTWWALTKDYKDSQGSPVASAVQVKQELANDYSLGRYLAEGHIEGLLGQALRDTFPVNQSAFYLILTSHDVYVEGFCTRRCASHFTMNQNVMTGPGQPAGNQHQIPYAWVGNPAIQCPGNCAWPFAKGEYGYDSEPLNPPSGDVGVDGMIINIAAMLAGTATNPVKNGFFQGHKDVPLEAATACTGVFGQEAYSGYPGLLLTESGTGVSFNAYGINNRKYLLPALWSPSTGTCRHPPA